MTEHIHARIETSRNGIKDGKQIHFIEIKTKTAMQRLVDEYNKDNEVNHTQCKILAILKHHNRPLTHAEICSYLYRESQTVGASFTRLLEKGYVKKHLTRRTRGA